MSKFSTAKEQNPNLTTSPPPPLSLLDQISQYYQFINSLYHLVAPNIKRSPEEPTSRTRCELPFFHEVLILLYFNCIVVWGVATEKGSSDHVAAPHGKI